MILRFEIEKFTRVLSTTFVVKRMKYNGKMKIDKTYLVIKASENFSSQTDNQADYKSKIKIEFTKDEHA